MMAVLFKPGGFEAPDPGSLGPAQTIFWVAFAGFFFGLTYGLLQIVGEFSVFRRERFAGAERRRLPPRQDRRAVPLCSW